MWNDRAVEIWGMNYPGFGGSTGPARLARIGPAAVAAFDEIKDSEAAGAPIIAIWREHWSDGRAARSCVPPRRNWRD